MDCTTEDGCCLTYSHCANEIRTATAINGCITPTCTSNYCDFLYDCAPNFSDIVSIPCYDVSDCQDEISIYCSTLTCEDNVCVNTLITQPTTPQGCCAESTDCQVFECQDAICVPNLNLCVYQRIPNCHVSPSPSSSIKPSSTKTSSPSISNIPSTTKSNSPSVSISLSSTSSTSESKTPSTSVSLTSTTSPSSSISLSISITPTSSTSFSNTQTTTQTPSSSLTPSTSISPSTSTSPSPSSIPSISSSGVGLWLWILLAMGGLTVVVIVIVVVLVVVFLRKKFAYQRVYPLDLIEDDEFPM